MAEQTKPLYKCTQQELYEILELAWDNCTANLAAFTAYKSKYVAAFVTTNEAAITAASDLPDEEVRNSEHEVLRTDLIPLNEICLNNYILLEGYIVDAFPDAQHNAKFEAAGKTHYAKAFNENWEETVALNNSMRDFITANVAALTAGGNMPAGFQATVNSGRTNFKNKYDLFKSARETGVGTEAKISANNTIYTNGIEMMEDGKRIFRNDFEKIKLFEFNSIKTIISPPGAASLQVAILIEGSNEPKAGANVKIQAEGGVATTVVTGADGISQFNGIDADRYVVTVSGSGITTKVVTKDVNTGVAARLKVFVTGV